MTTVNIEAEKEEILHNLEELEAAENRKDIERVLKLVTEDFVFMYRNSKIEGKEDAGEMLKESVKNFIARA
jgi:ketosteroid isomerase-like protein